MTSLNWRERCIWQHCDRKQMAAGFRALPLWAKALIAIGGGFLIGSFTYGLLVFYDKRKSTIHRKFSVNGTSVANSRRILMLGLDGAGKTSILSKFSKSDEGVKDKPTKGYNIMCFQVGGVSLNIWEIGGGEQVRSYWGNFLEGTAVLVFVVDSADLVRFDEAVEELRKLTLDERLRDVPIAVLANKQDIKGARSTMDIEAALRQHFDDQARTFFVMGTQAPPGQGIHSSVQDVEKWLSNFLKN